MKVYGSLTSPYARKVRILIREKGLACEFVVQNPNESGSLVPQLNPLGKVPVMTTDNGKVLYDSALLVEYLDSLQAPTLVPATGEARWDVQRWHYLAMGIVDAVVTRLMETRRSPDKQLPEVIGRQEEKIARGLDVAEQTAKGDQFLVGDSFSLADIALGVALEYIDLRYPHDWRGRHPGLAKWLTGIAARASFTETQPPGAEKNRKLH